MQPESSQGGFSILELMVSVAILGIVSVVLFQVLDIQKRVYMSHGRVVDIQEDTRLVLDLMGQEARMAGFMVPRRASLASIDSAVAPDTICFSDPTVLAQARLDQAIDHFDRGRVQSLAANQIDFQATHQDVDLSGNASDFTVNAGVILSDGVRSHCAMVTQVNAVANNVQVAPAIPNPIAWDLPNTRAIPAVIYQVNGACGNGLTRNCQLLSAEIEDLQAEFGVDDVVMDGVIDRTTTEFPVDDLNAGGGRNPARVRLLRLTVSARTSQADPEYTGPGFAPAANRPAGATDGFRRRRFSTVVLPRNILPQSGV